MYSIKYYYKNQPQQRNFNNLQSLNDFWGMLKADPDVHGIQNLK